MRIALGKKFYQGYHRRPLPSKAFSFYMMCGTDFASYADVSTPYVSADTINGVIKRLETASVKLFKWFADNQMKANLDKCHLIVSKSENVSMPIGPFEIKKNNSRFNVESTWCVCRVVDLI